MREHEGYRPLLDRQGCFFAGYETFCYEPTPWGLGYAPRDIERIIEERKTAQARAHQPATLFDVGRPTVEEQEVINPSQRRVNYGENAEYLTARIARDRPDILDHMKAGDYPSVRAASMHRGRLRDASGPGDGRVGARRGVERVRRGLPRDL